MKILILSDSLALARDRPEIVNYRKTWPALLRQAGFDVCQVSIGGATSGDLLRQVTYYRCFRPDLVILQVGIVDCAPRFASRLEIDLLKTIPIAGAWLIHKLNRRWVRRLRGVTYTSLSNFIKNVRGIVDDFNSSQKIVVGIMPATVEYERIVPGIAKNVEKYNQALRQSFGDLFLDVTSLGSECLMSDFHHLNELGHSKIFDAVLMRVNQSVDNTYK